MPLLLEAALTTGVLLGLVIEAVLHPLKDALIQIGWASRFLDDDDE